METKQYGVMTGVMTKISSLVCATKSANFDTQNILVSISNQELHEHTLHEDSDVTIKHAWCQMCGAARMHCSTLCYIQNGRWVHVEGNPKANNNYGNGCKSLCAKGNAAIGSLYSPKRLMFPMKRIGEKGQGKFERCTWDEALDGIAAKLKEQKELYGAKSYGVLSPQYYAVLGTLGRRFLNVHGSPNYLHSGICSTQRTFSRLVTIGGESFKKANATDPGQLKKTKLLINWGKNTENSGVNKGNPYARLNAIDNGQITIDIRPMLDALASKADIWVPVRPGTDCALAMACLNIIIEEELYDHDFVNDWCYGFDRLAAHLKPYTAKWASEQTGVPEEQITEVARMMGTIKPMGICLGNGIGDQQNDGHWTVACICLIEAITGNLGIAGGGGAGLIPPKPTIKTNPINVLSEMLEMTAEDEKNGYMAGVSNLVGPETPRWFQKMESQESGPTSAYFKGINSILTEKPYPLRCIFAQCSNPLSATRQPKKVAEALKKLDFYVVMDTHWNSSCIYADYVLPAASNYETSHQFGTKNTPSGTFIAINQGLFRPMGEARSDWQYYLDLACRMGYGQYFWNGDMDACLKEQLDGSGISLEELRAANDGIIVEREDQCDGASVSGDCLGAAAQNKPVPTSREPEYKNYKKMFEKLPHGKVPCYNEILDGKPNADETGVLSPLPVYHGPAESIANTPEIAEEYPLVFSDVHAYRLCNHSYYSDIPYLQELQPHPWVKINTRTAKQYSIKNGDWVKIESPHGWVKLKAHTTECVPLDVLMSRRGWRPEYDKDHLRISFDGSSEVNVLYDCDQSNFDPFNSAMSKQTLVKISKIEDEQ